MNWRAIAIGGVTGLIVPLVMLGYHTLSGQSAGLSTVVIWPSSIMLMATEAMPKEDAKMVLAQSVVINIVVYAVVGGIVGFFLRKREQS